MQVDYWISDDHIRFWSSEKISGKKVQHITWADQVIPVTADILHSIHWMEFKTFSHKNSIPTKRRSD